MLASTGRAEALEQSEATEPVLDVRRSYTPGHRLACRDLHRRDPVGRPDQEERELAAVFALREQAHRHLAHEPVRVERRERDHARVLPGPRGHPETNALPRGRGRPSLDEAPAVPPVEPRELGRRGSLEQSRRRPRGLRAEGMALRRQERQELDQPPHTTYRRDGRDARVRVVVGLGPHHPERCRRLHSSTVRDPWLRSSALPLHEAARAPTRRG